MKGRCYVNNTETLVEESIGKLKETLAKLLEVVNSNRFYV